MARYDHLPIFRRAYELTLLVEDLVKGFSRYHKYGLGQDLRAAARRLLRLIVRVNNTERKLPGLEELRLHLIDLQLLARLGKDPQVLAPVVAPAAGGRRWPGFAVMGWRRGQSNSRFRHCVRPGWVFD